MKEGATHKIRNKPKVDEASVLHNIENAIQSQIPIFQSKIVNAQNKAKKRNEPKSPVGAGPRACPNSVGQASRLVLKKQNKANLNIFLIFMKIGDYKIEQSEIRHRLVRPVLTEGRLVPTEGAWRTKPFNAIALPF